MNVKKYISLFLVFLLLVSNIGLVFDVHYCGDEIASVSLRSTLNSMETSSKCCEKNEKEASCCKDKLVNFEKKSDNATVKMFLFQFVSPLIVPKTQSFVFDFIPNFKNNQIISYYSDANAPPLFKLYSQYIFYA